MQAAIDANPAPGDFDRGIGAVWPAFLGRGDRRSGPEGREVRDQNEVELVLKLVVNSTAHGGEFLEVFILRNRGLARSRQRKPRREFPTRLFSPRPVSSRSAAPICPCRQSRDACW